MFLWCLDKCAGSGTSTWQSPRLVVTLPRCLSSVPSELTCESVIYVSLGG